MLLFVDLQNQIITAQPLVVSQVDSVSVPRAQAVPIWVQFVKDGEIVDPEAAATALTTSTVSATPTFRAVGHEFIVGDTVTIADHGGLPISIISSAVSTTPFAVSTITATAHGLTTGGNGTAADGSALAAGKYLVFIEDHPVSPALDGIISSTSTSTPAVCVTTANHGLSTGDLVTIAGTTAAAVNATLPVTVINATTFTVNVSGTGGTTGGTWIRQASDINGTHVATCLDANSFTIPIKNSSVLYGGTVTCTTTTPTANGNRVIASVTADTFTTTGPTLTAAGTGGTAVKLVDLDLRWSVKADGEFDGAMVATVNSFLKSGSGNTTIFKGSCNYITTELNSLLGIDASVTGTFTVTGTNTIFTAASAHGLAVGDTITFTAATTIPTGLITAHEQIYYILTVPTTTTFTVAATASGTAISPTSAGVGTLTYIAYPTADDETQATLMAELSWTGATPSKTNWVTHYVRNDIYKGDETNPVTVNGEDGKTLLVSGENFKAVTFTTPFASANWHFLGTPMITNTGSSPLGVDVVGLTSRLTTGFTVQFSGTLDAVASYYLEWQARLD